MHLTSHKNETSGAYIQYSTSLSETVTISFTVCKIPEQFMVHFLISYSTYFHSSLYNCWNAKFSLDSLSNYKNNLCIMYDKKNKFFKTDKILNLVHWKKHKTSCIKYVKMLEG